MGTISLETLFSRMFSQTLLSKVDSAQVFTHTPLHTGSGGPGCPAPTAGMQGSSQLLGAPNLLPPFPLAQTSSCWRTAARAGGAPPGFFPLLHRQWAPNFLKRHHPDPHPTPKPRLPASHARRPGSLTVGDTACHILAIATLEHGLALKILYEAESRRAPGSHRDSPRRLNATQPAAAAAVAASTTPQCSTRASEDRAKPLGSSRAGKTWQPA